MSVSFTLSELVPWSIVVYGIYIQIDWHKNEDLIIDEVEELDVTGLKKNFNSVLTDLANANTEIDRTRNEKD
jgi:hypothetical protein